MLSEYAFPEINNLSDVSFVAPYRFISLTPYRWARRLSELRYLYKHPLRSLLQKHWFLRTQMDCIRSWYNLVARMDHIVHTIHCSIQTFSISYISNKKPNSRVRLE